MKTTVKQIAATTLVALLMMAINGKAEGTERAASSQANTETTLQLENWMTDENVWNTNFANNAGFILETEINLELEDWMINTESWNVGFDFAEEVEPGLELENWMINEVTWDNNYEEKDSDLNLENWMINGDIWE